MIVKAQISFPMDSTLPRDQVVITPHYQGGIPDSTFYDAIVNNLKSIATVGDVPFTIKYYDAQKAKPNFPLASRTNKTGSITSGLNHDVALCLSFYSGSPRPRTRGRLYIPPVFIQGQIGIRPTSTQMTNTLAFSQLYKSLPSGWLGVVYSRADNAAYGITNFWVDDEWDTQRRRGLKSTTRVTATNP